jgi:hypothetical protein
MCNILINNCSILSQIVPYFKTKFSNGSMENFLVVINFKKVIL